jgi:hypothetical protein
MMNMFPLSGWSIFVKLYTVEDYKGMSPSTGICSSLPSLCPIALG